VQLIGTIQANRHAYLPSDFDERLYVVGLNGFQVVERLPLGDEVNSVAVSADGSVVYLAPSNSAEIRVLDRASLQFIDSIPLPRPADAITLAPGGTQLWVSSIDVLVLDLETRQISATIDVPNTPFVVRFPADGLTAYVGMTGFEETVAIIDAQTATLTDSIRLATDLGDLEVNSAGTVLYASSNRFVFAYDLQLQAVFDRIEFEDDVVSMLESRDASLLYVADDSSALSYMSIPANEVLNTVPSASSPRGIAQDPVSGAVYVVGFLDARLDGFTEQTGALFGRIAIGNRTWRPGDFAGVPILSNLAGRVDNSAALVRFVCENLDTGQRVTGAPDRDDPRQWDCTARGLQGGVGERVRVTLVMRSD
ncbi:MAG: YncE family protein, partial [Pseudomonadota bacterium]